MSEGQKREARRIVELLDEMGYLWKIQNKERCNVYEVRLIASDVNNYNNAKEKLIYILTQAIAIFNGEELEKLMRIVKKE